MLHCYHHHLVPTNLTSAVTSMTVWPSRRESPGEIQNAPYSSEVEKHLLSRGQGTDVADTYHFMRVGEMLLARITLAHMLAHTLAQEVTEP
jgi:hypothetical protein